MEVYLPWNNTWLELPPLPLMNDQVHRMDHTRIFSLNKNGVLALFLLGGSRTLDIQEGEFTAAVWWLNWFSSNQSYHWTENEEIAPPMGEIYQ